PDEATVDSLAWNDKGDWARIEVFRNGRNKIAGVIAKDYVENTLRYRVPEGKAGLLRSFDESLIIDSYRETLSACGRSEENNTLTLNLADEIVKGNRDVAS